MQKYSVVAATETLQNSLDKFNETFATILSSSSGTSFPTASLQLGMPCYRTDQRKLYVLTSISPDVWTIVADLTVGAVLWNSVNDGAGSGLDADLVDGLQASQFVRSDITDPSVIFGVKTITKSLIVRNAWSDTGIKDGDLATGTYAVSVYSDNYAVGGGNYAETASGIMQWFAGDTNSSEASEIILHRAGHAPNANPIFLRVLRTPSADVNNLKLQIANLADTTSATNYVFNFRRLI